MKELDSFSVERLEEWINTPEKYDHRYSPRINCDELRALARIALAAKRAEPIGYLEQNHLDYLQSGSDADIWPEGGAGDIPVYLAPQLNSPEMPDYKSALLGLLTNRISKDHLGFFTLAEINKTNLARAVEVSEATINFENVPQVKIGECLIPNGWLITQDWIKCSDHKPDSSGEFLVYETLNNRVQHDYWVPDDCAALGLGFWNHYANYVTHWMPLPTAPEKENG